MISNPIGKGASKEDPRESGALVPADALEEAPLGAPRSREASLDDSLLDRVIRRSLSDMSRTRGQRHAAA
eukprot:3099250-Prymnesium_polylepis.1